MKKKCDRAIVLMAIGKRYERQLNFVLPQFEQYAKFCKADLQVVREAPDPANTHPILTQKLLIPSLFSEYNAVAYFDLDIFISTNAPSIFEAVSPGAGFSACISPRGEPGFINMFLHHYDLPEKVNETHATYFADRGFALKGIDTEKLFSINGGVWVARPKLVADLFRETYFDISKMREENAGLNILFEEELMAYSTQKNELFQALDERFNKQIIYDIYKEPHSKLASIRRNVLYKVVKNLNRRRAPGSHIYARIMPSIYVEYVEELLKENYVVHFAGGFEYLGIKPKGSYLS